MTVHTGSGVLARPEALAVLVEAAAEAMIGTDGDDDVWFFNPAAERLLGWSAGEVLGRSIWSLAADHPQLEPRKLRDVVRGGEAVRRTTAVRHRDGRRLAVVLEARPLVAPDGEYRGAVITALDVSARREAERQAERAWARLAAIVEAAPDAIVTEDAQGRIATWNPGAERMLGRTAAEAVGRPYEELVVPDAERAAHRGLRAAVGDGATAARRTSALRADGGKVPVEVTAAALADVDGAPQGIVLLVRDVTALAEAELELRDRAARLERSNADLEAFAFVASHDLQEPLRLVTQGARVVATSAADRLDADERALLDTVVDAAVRMGAQVEALMELARVALRTDDHGGTPLRTGVDDALGALGVVVAETGARVEVDGVLPEVAMPRAELALVLQNLLSNAVRFRRPGVPLCVLVGAREAHGEVVVRIRDNGIGLTPADQERLFGVLARAHGDVPGTGLGLALCRRLLERRGGSIGVHSDGPGHGACFELRLPAAGAA